jgi:thymidylate synthase
LKLPKLRLRQVDSIDSYKMEDIQLVDYHSWPAIKAPVAV